MPGPLFCYDGDLEKRRVMRRFVLKEVSAVDSPAQEHARAVIMKRFDDTAKRFDASGKGEMHNRLAVLYDTEMRGHPELTSEANFAAAWRKLTAAEQDRIRAEEAAAADEQEREEAVRRRETQKMDTPAAILADYPAPAVAAYIVDAGRTSVFSEHDLTKSINDFAAQDRRPGESAAQSFTRIYCADDDNGRLFRQAMKIVQGSPPKHAAYDLLMTKARELRKSEPKLTEAQSFTKVYCAPENAALVALQKSEQTS